MSTPESSRQRRGISAFACWAQILQFQKPKASMSA
jgi:hypothetical protein